MDKQDIRGIVEQLGGVEKILKEFEKFKANTDFFRDNHKFLVEKYPNKWVAIQDEGVVATSRSLKGLMSIMKKAGIETETCYVQFLDPNPKPQILTVKQARETLAFFYVLIYDGTYPCNFSNNSISEINS